MNNRQLMENPALALEVLTPRWSITLAGPASTRSFPNFAFGGCSSDYPA